MPKKKSRVSKSKVSAKDWSTRKCIILITMFAIVGYLIGSVI